MEFMSPEHVTAMNAVLASSDAVRSAARLLPQTVLVAYELRRESVSELVHWTLELGPQGARFGLEPPAQEADIVLRGSWGVVVGASREARLGREVDTQLELSGDVEVLAAAQDLFRVVREVATVDVDFPDR